MITIQATTDLGGQNIFEIVENGTTKTLAYASYDVRDENNIKFSIYSGGTMVFNGAYAELTIPAGIPSAQFTALVDLFNIAGGGAIDYTAVLGSIDTYTGNIDTTTTNIKVDTARIAASNTNIETNTSDTVDAINAFASNGMRVNYPHISNNSSLKTTESTFLFGGKFEDINDGLFNESLVGGATSVYSSVGVTTTCSNLGDIAIRQSKNFAKLDGTNSLSCEFVFPIVCFDTFEIKALGMGKITNTTITSGAFLTHLGTGSGSFQFRIYDGGSAIITVDKSNWNGDKLDGTGSSGLNIDNTSLTFQGAYKFRIEVNSFNMGEVSLYIYYNGVEHLCNRIYTQASQSTVTYAAPLFSNSRWHLCYYHSFLNISPTYFVHSYHAMYSNGVNFPLNPKKVNIATPAVTLYPTALTSYIVMLLESNVDTAPEMWFKTIESLSQSNDDYKIEILRNPTFLGPVIATSQVSGSYLSSGFGNATTNTVSGFDEVLWTGYGLRNNRTIHELNEFYKIGASITGTLDTIGIAVTPLTANLTLAMSLNINLY